MKQNLPIFLSGLFVGILLLLFFGNSLPFGLSPFNQATITVTGTAKQNLDNTEASFYVTVRRRADDTKSATEATNQAMDDLLSKLDAFGIAKSDIQTESINTYETYVPEGKAEILIYPPRPPETPTKKVWEATQSLSIKLTDVARANDLTAILQSIDSLELSGPNFTIDQDKAEADLLAEAVKDAKAQAENMVKAGGQRLGKISSISDLGNYPMPYRAEVSMTKDMATSAPQLEPGSTEQSRQVQVTFFIR